MDRIHMSGNVPADIAERLSDQPVDVTDATEDEAITAIVEDHLLLGYCYPRKGGKDCLTAGMVVQEYAEADEIEAMLTSLVYGCGEPMDRWQRYAEAIVKDSAPKYLREKCPDLIERMQEEMAGEE